MYYAKNLPEVKAIVENFEGSGVLVTQAKDSMQPPGLADQLFKINDQYEYTIKEAVQELDIMRHSQHQAIHQKKATSTKS